MYFYSKISLGGFPKLSTYLLSVTLILYLHKYFKG